MAGTTLTNLRAEVRSFIDESTAKFFTAAEIDRWLNRGIRHISEYITNLNDEFFIGIASFNYPANTERIDLGASNYLNTTFNRIKQVEYLSGTISSTNLPQEIRYINFHDKTFQYDALTVYVNNRHKYFYSLAGQYLYLRPLPSAAVPIRVHYIPDVTEMTTTTDTIYDTNPALPLATEEIVITYAAKCAFIKAGTKNAELDEHYHRLLKTMKSAIVDRSVQAPREVIYVEDEFYD